MLSFFSGPVACPVEPAVKQWVEHRLTWLVGQFGRQRLLGGTVVLPTPEFFPDPFDGSPDSARPILARVCGYMGIDPAKVELDFYEYRRPPDAKRSDAAAGRFRVWLEESNLYDPTALVAALAHAVGHIHLDRRLAAEAADREPLADLLTVFFGLGIFSANAVLHESYWNNGEFSGWRIGRRGYLGMPAYGYALALYAQARCEDDPPWARYLRLDVRTALRQGQRFLRETGDTTFRG
ncbi:MAG TPA: hypothetical protein VKE40_22465 [Gemmataceae bacterium]|nr:hypothetical protein [Gemmataceae bacterium]